MPIPGAQQHKRPRRRYEEIERMYKCGWNGCEKAYGTLNHLNAHVTMQSHGQKRTPEGMCGHFDVVQSCTLFRWSLQTWRARQAPGVVLVLVQRHFGGAPTPVECPQMRKLTTLDPGLFFLAPSYHVYYMQPSN